MVKEYFKIPCRKEGYHIVDPSTVKSVFACGICDAQYAEKQTAEKCESMPKKEPAFKTGDKVKLINLDFIVDNYHRKELSERSGIIGEIGEITPRFEYRLDIDNQHVTQYYVDFDKSNHKDNLLFLSLSVRPIPEKSLEKVI